MDAEYSLISKIIQVGGIENAVSRGITEEHFDDPTHKEVYSALSEHIRRYKVPPTPQVIKDSFPDFRPEVSTESLDYLIDRFIGLVKYRATATASRDLAKLTQNKKEWANLDLHVLEIARNLAQLVPSSQTAMLSDVRKRIAEYEKRKREGVFPGIKMGIPTIDNLTLGIQPPDYVTVAGYMGTGKSTLAQFILFNSYLQNKKPMFISLEMDAEALFRKWDTMATNFSYMALKKLELEEGDMDKWEEWGEKAENSKAERDIIVIDDIGKCTVDKVYAETVRYSPDLVAVDYVGLMDTPNNTGSHWEKVTYTTKGLKQNARTLKIPVIGVAQTNEEESGLGNIAGSKSIGRDSDIVIGLFQKEEWKERERMNIKLLKSRESKTGSVDMNWKPETMEFSEMTEKDWFQPAGHA